MPIAYLCDFDGTISPRDIGAAFVRAYSPGGAAARESLLGEWLAGRMGHRELTRRQVELVRASADDALAYSRRFRLDPQFAPFAREALGRGDAVMVVSEGFDFYVRDHLDRAGLGAVPWAANHVQFADGGLHVEFPFADPACDACGNCKAQHVRRYRSLGFHTVLVGDGLSDRHGASAADTVFARGGLAEWCEAEQIEWLPFEHFGDVAEWGRRRDADLNPLRRR